MADVVEPERLPSSVQKLLQTTLDGFAGYTFEVAMNVLINAMLHLVKRYGQSNYASLREYIENHIQTREALERRQSGEAVG